MGEVVSRRLQSSDRFFVQAADQAIKRDVIRALVELITNCDDSYRRLDSDAQPDVGRIIIEIQRKDHNSVIRIRDFAQGISGEDMDSRVGMYAEDTSGINQGKSVRGLWGRGLKDAILGLGHGTVTSIKNGHLYRCSLTIEGAAPKYTRYDTEPADNNVRKGFQVPEGNGTTVEIVVSRSAEVKIPQIENIKHGLQMHFELRKLMQSDKRSVLLRYLDASGKKIKQEIELRYRPPIGNLLLDEEFNIPGYDVSAHLQLHKSSEPLSTPAEYGPVAQGGFIFVSGASAVELSMLKFENNEFAEKFYGNVTCDYIHELLKRGEPITTATRDGLNWKSHPFAKALKLAVEAKVEPFVQDEEKKAKSANREVVDKKLKDRLNNVVAKLNEIAEEELGEGGSADSGGGKGPKIPFVPESRFGFVPEYYEVQVSKSSRLVLRCMVPDVVEPGSIVMIESSSPEVSVLTPSVTIERSQEHPSIGQAYIEIEGLQVGAEGIVTATLDGLTAEAFVKVISKKMPAPPKPTDPRSHGIVKNISFDPESHTGQRVSFRRADSTVVISTASPSVSPYIGLRGEGADTAQAQVMIAELVTEAVCKEIARRGVENNKFLSLSGSTQDAMNREYYRIQNKYAHQIHAALVEKKYHRDQLPLPIAGLAVQIAAPNDATIHV